MRPYERVLIKLSGEALLGEQPFGIDANVVARIGNEILAAMKTGVEVALVIGGGNIFRGVQGVAKTGMARTAADEMGMLATVMNGIALKDGFAELNLKSRILTASPMPKIADLFSYERASSILENKEVLILPGGTGNPYFTTDSAAVLRALEIRAGLLLKGTKVDGVYSADPVKDPNATKYDELSFDEAIEKQLRVMDLTAFTMARENSIPIRVFDMTKAGAITNALMSKPLGTLVH